MVTINDIVAAVAETTGVAVSDIKTKVSGKDERRSRLLVIVFARFYLYTFREIGEWFGMTTAMIQYYEELFEYQYEHSKKVKPEAELIFGKLNWQGWAHQARAMKLAKENNFITIKST